MPVPIADEIQQREDNATERLDSLESAYSAFIEKWNAIEQEELQALEKMHGHVDKKKLQNILEHITHLNE